MVCLGKEDEMPKERIKVVFVEAFDGRKYLLRTDRAYKVVLKDLIERLIEREPMGSLIFMSLRYMGEEAYNKVPASQGLCELEKERENNVEEKDG